MKATPGDYTVEIFASKSFDAGGYGQGDDFVRSGKATVSATGLLVQGQGAGDFSISVIGFFVAGYTHITAIATDSNGNTSEFSQSAGQDIEVCGITSRIEFGD